MHTPLGYDKLWAIARTTTPTRGYSATKDQLLARLRRIEGQVRGVQGMVQDDRYCIDVLTQISAIQAALDKVALGLLDDHARHCVVGGAARGHARGAHRRDDGRRRPAVAPRVAGSGRDRRRAAVSRSG